MILNVNVRLEAERKRRREVFHSCESSTTNTFCVSNRISKRRKILIQNILIFTIERGNRVSASKHEFGDLRLFRSKFAQVGMAATEQ